MKETIKLFAYSIGFILLIGFAPKTAKISAKISSKISEISEYKSESTPKQTPKQTSSCPMSRADIKTLTDSGSYNLRDYPLEVQEIMKFKIPNNYSDNLPRTNKEFVNCKTNCYIKGYTETEFGYKLNIQGFDDTTAVINAYILNPNCDQVKKSKYFSNFESTYKAFNDYAAAKKINRGCYKIIGTLLYEKNTISICPVLQIVKFR